MEASRPAPAPHRLPSTKPSEDTSIAATEASTPDGLTPPVPPSSIRHTPPSPIPAPARCAGRGRSPSSAHPASIIARGASAITVDATLVASSWDAVYTSTKKALVLSSPSTAERHHHTPRGSSRHSASSSSPAGSARTAAPNSGWSGGRNRWVTK